MTGRDEPDLQTIGYGAAFTSLHIAFQASICDVVRLGVKLVFESTLGSSSEKAAFKVGSVIAFITSWFESP